MGKTSLLARVALFVGALLLTWRLLSTRDNTKEDKYLLQQLDEEKKACLWRKGLENDRLLGDERTFSTFNCPVGQEAYPSDLCTVHLVYLNHTERAVMARTPAATTSRSAVCFTMYHSY